MSLVFAALTPHPPIMVPEVGGRELLKLHATVSGMETLGRKFAEAQPELVFLISPHSLLRADAYTLSCAAEMRGDLAEFGAPQPKLSFSGALGLTSEIVKKLEDKFPVWHYAGEGGELSLDHASFCPLYYLAQNFKKFELLIAGFSGLNLAEHFAYGQALGEIFETSSQKIAVIASGDLSHRLIPEAPAGYDPLGKVFDEQLVRALVENNVETILNLDEDLIKHAGECGLRSIVIMLGILSNFQAKFQKLSYEGPFGVGYLTGNFEF